MEKAEITKDVLVLLEGDLQFSTDLNASPRDLFYSNFQEKALRLGGFTEGQLCYVLGTKPSDTLSEHYIDYANDFLQYDIVCRLNRWSYIYAQKPVWDDCIPRWESGEVTFTSHDEATPHPAGLAGMSLDLRVASYSEVGEVVVTVESDHGIQGKLVVYKSEGGKNADRTETKL